MMAKKPADRFSDPSSLLVELHAVVAEGAQQGWATGLDQAVLSQILFAADQRSAATSRLDDLMKTTAPFRPKRPTKRWLVAAIVGCALAGAALAAPPAQDRCGPVHNSARPIFALGSALSRQTGRYRSCLWCGDHLFSASCGVLPQSRQARPGYHYLKGDDSAKAIRPLQELAAQPDFQTFGIAGLVVAYTNLNDDERHYDENQRRTADMRAVALASSRPPWPRCSTTPSTRLPIERDSSSIDED